MVLHRELQLVGGAHGNGCNLGDVGVVEAALVLCHLHDELFVARHECIGKERVEAYRTARHDIGCGAIRELLIVRRRRREVVVVEIEHREVRRIVQDDERVEGCGIAWIGLPRVIDIDEHYDGADCCLQIWRGEEVEVIGPIRDR